MRINNNLSALTAYNALTTTTNNLTKTIQQLSTGLRINSAADDAAGFAISEKMRSQISGLDTARMNTQDGISLLQTAEGALNATSSMLQRMRELAVQAANDSLTSNDREYIQLEIDELKDQIDRIAHNTQFNKKRILDGSAGALWSSSDAGLKARISGGLTHIDQFGQKVSAEGNYRVVITAEAGKGQVQKSGIFSVLYDKNTAEHFFTDRVVVTRTREIQVPVTKYRPKEVWIKLNDGVDTFGRTSGTGWDIADMGTQGKCLNITKDGSYQIYGSVDEAGNTVETENYIRVAPGVTANIRLRNVNVVAKGYALDATGATVNLYLDPGEYDNVNSFYSTGSSRLHTSGVMAPAGSTLTITSIDGDYATTGKLKATGSLHGAGIGGACTGGVDSGNITIYGGDIEAIGGYCAAGIGGGWHGTGGSITIYGGIVNASSIEGGAGIGAGGYQNANNSYVNSGKIIIAGGEVIASGGQSYSDPAGFMSSPSSYSRSYSSVGEGAGIGGGGGFTGGTIIIDPDATVSASGYTDIGSGEYANTVTYTTKDVDIPKARKGFTVQTEMVETMEYETETEEIEELHEVPASYIEEFYTQNGSFLLEEPQKLTITQGDGKTASVMLYSDDTMYSMAEKINNAIAEDLGQSKYADDTSHFCTIAEGTQGTSESIFEADPVYDDDGEMTGYRYKGTMLVRSVKPGSNGELTFSGNEDLMRVLGFNTIHEAEESSYTVSVYDAHSGNAIVQNVKTSENVITGAIQNVDIEFDAMAGINASWNEDTKSYNLSGSDKYTEFLHLKDNGITFQTGANTGEDFMLQLGDSSSNALGISGVNVLTRENSSRAINILDRAINRISLQRAQIGSYENALEHTMETLTTSSANLTSAESRIRDADMSATMMEFVKLQILNQSGTSMLSQANQLPQSVLNLLQ